MQTTPSVADKPKKPLPTPGRAITSNPSKLHRRTRKKHMNIRRAHDIQQAVRLGIRSGENKLLRLITERKCMRSMKSPRVPNALRATDHRRATDTKRPRLMQQPFTNGLMTVSPVALGEESQLTAVHHDARIWRPTPGQPRYARDADADGALVPAWLT